MLTRVDVQSENPFYLNIRDARPTDSIIVEKIEGLSPPDVDLFMGDYARDGGFYSGRRVPPRTVIFTLMINPNYKNDESTSGLRRFLYKTFMDPFIEGDSVGFILKDDELPDRTLSGYTEKFEGDIFSDDTTVQITVRCPNPYLRDYSQTVLDMIGPSSPFTYNGSAEAGLIMSAEIVVSTDTLVFDLNGKKMALTYPFVVGDTVVINTNRGNRSIRLVREVADVSTTTDILYSLQTGSNWLEIHSESNIISAYGVTETSAVANLTEIRYYAQHWGI